MNYADDGTESTDQMTLSQVVDSEVDTSEERWIIFLRDLDRLEEGASKVTVKFNKDECTVLHLGRGNQRALHSLGSVLLGSSFAEKYLAVLANMMNGSQQCITVATKANWILGCNCRVITSKERNVIIPLFSAIIRICIKYLVSTVQKRHARVQSMATKMIQAWRTCPMRKS